MTIQVELEARNKSSLLCSDLYIFATTMNFHIENVVMSGKHVVTFNKLSHEQIENVLKFGLHIFRVCDSLHHIIPDILMTAALFVGGLGTNPNIPFFGSKPTWYQNWLNPLMIKHTTGFEW
jgi:hypothetical protein